MTPPETPPENGPDWDDETALLGELGTELGHDPSATPPEDRVAAIRAAASSMAPAGRPSRRRALLTGGIAAAVTGIAGYAVAEARDETRDDDQPVVASVPMEPITFTPTTSSARVSSSSLINHTWGTELLLDVSGLSAGTAYVVVYETPAGEVPAGSLLAVPDVLMKCRFNAAPLRADVRAIELRSPAGDAVLRSELPPQAT